MPQFSSSNLLVFLLAGMLIWVSVNMLLAALRLNRSYELGPSRFIYPANCKPELCQDPLGFIRFISPRLVIFGLVGLLLAALMLVCELTQLLASLPDWFTQGVSLFLFLPLFVWYVIFINKAAKKFW